MKIKDLIVQPITSHIDHRGYLIETFRKDKIDFDPQMMYISYSQPNVCRGAHLHIHQQDYFIFVGPANFRVVVVDNRPDSETYKEVDDFCVGENKPAYVIIPTNCWHGYKNISSCVGMVINIPDKLYKGLHYKDLVDEVRSPWDKIYEWPEITD
jgi:dTDP-4-dehydrorhamnose 3,5-epimerase-like enzyme